MFEDMTVEAIKSEIMAGTADRWDTSEGSFLDTIVSPMAYKIREVYSQLELLMPILCLDRDSGDYIIRRCADYGIVRQEGTKADGQLSLTGTAGTVIPAQTVFMAAGLAFLTTEAVTLTGGTDTAQIEAADVGKAYNLPASTQVVPQNVLSGLTGAAFPEATAGGTDPESTEEMRQRLLYRLQNAPASGNAAEYKVWATSVDGIEDAIITPLAFGAGTVKVTLIGRGHTTVSLAKIAEVADYIDARCPIGADVSVYSCSIETIPVSATVTKLATETDADIKDRIEKALTEYFAAMDVTQVNTVYIAKAVQLIMACDGVVNVTGVQLCGDDEDVALTAGSVPSLGTLEVTVT